MILPYPGFTSPADLTRLFRDIEAPSSGPSQSSELTADLEEKKPS
jgi:hypothetical protein